MYIEKEDWLKIVQNVENLYWDEDRMSRDGLYFLKEIESTIKSVEKKQKLIEHKEKFNFTKKEKDLENEL